MPATHAPESPRPVWPRARKILGIGACVGVAVLLCSFLLTRLSQTGAGRVSLELVNYRQFTKGGTPYTEVMLTNGSENRIFYYKVYDSEQMLFGPLVKTNVGLGWSEAGRLPQFKGIKFVETPLQPHQAVVALQPVITGIGNYKFGIMYKPYQPIQPNVFLRRLNELVFNISPRCASVKYMIPELEAVAWCPQTISEAQALAETSSRE